MKNKKINQPLVSIIMPAYNAEDYIVQSLDSIFAQTYKNFELIVVDDASTDRTPQILAAYKKLHTDKMTVATMPKNLNSGGDTCANKALKLAKGTYIARMDADDIAHPHRLEKQVDFLEKNPEIYLVGSNADVIDKNGTIIGEKTEPLTHSSIYDSYFTFHPLIHPTCMLRRLDGKKPFSYRIGYSANNDYYTFFSLLCEGKKFANLKEKLLLYRIHGKNDTFVQMKKKYFNTLRIRLYMTLKYGYMPSFKALMLTAFQGVVIISLPDKTLTLLYFLAKGIITPSFALAQLMPSPFKISVSQQQA